MSVEEIFSAITPADEQAMTQAQQRWNDIAKPLGSLGLLETALIRMAGMYQTSNIPPFKSAVVVMCADNGVVAEGVTQTGQEVTAIVTENMSSGATSVCRMANCVGATVVPVDIGVAMPVHGAKILQKNIRRGTANMTKAPAMSRQDAEAAILVGVELVGDLKTQGYNLIATGEMGIGNTTTASAITAVLLHLKSSAVTGRGAGLSDDGLMRKISAIERAIQVNQPDPDDALDVLSKVGGLDIAGLVGVFLGCAYHHIPVLVDGVISMAAALVAIRLCPTVRDYVVASHVSSEPATVLLIEALELTPFLHAGMHLGEGTGAVAVMPILNMALAVYGQMSTFDDIEIEAYQEM